MFSFSAPATAPARSWPKASFANWERSAFNAYSAGSHPKGTVNPLALKTIAAFGYPTKGLRSKNWDEFATPEAPKLDFAFRLCDDAAGETCPGWPGTPMTAHWGIEDPAAVEGTNIEKERAFAQASRFLRNRITVFIALPIRSLDRLSLANRLKEIGMEGASHREKVARSKQARSCTSTAARQPATGDRWDSVGSADAFLVSEPCRS
jgi:arsenate reductase (thioredoxin)